VPFGLFHPSRRGCSPKLEEKLETPHGRLSELPRALLMLLQVAGLPLSARVRASTVTVTQGQRARSHAGTASGAVTLNRSRASGRARPGPGATAGPLAPAGPPA
jgi:hypothetical protein